MFLNIIAKILIWAFKMYFFTYLYAQIYVHWIDLHPEKMYIYSNPKGIS